MANTNLKEAKAAKNDEFYTQFHDIEIEMNAYLEYDPGVFRGKTVLLPCDDPEWSNFTRYFAAKFDELGLKKLVSTSYAPDSKKYKTPYQPSLFEQAAPQFDPSKAQVKGKIFVLERDRSGDGRINIDDLEWQYMEGDGDFRSDEVTALRDEADFIITNPPFSLFREFLAWIMEGGKKFAVIGNMNAITYKEVFPLIKNNQVWLGGTGFVSDMVFAVPEGAKIKDSDRQKAARLGYVGNYTRLGNSCWYTNIEHGRRHQPLALMTMADNLRFSKHKELKGKAAYDRYDNYDAIEVPFTDAIPSDYEGVMGVPISFLDKYCPEQFEIVNANDYRMPHNVRIKPHGLIKDKEATITTLTGQNGGRRQNKGGGTHHVRKNLHQTDYPLREVTDGMSTESASTPVSLSANYYDMVARPVANGIKIYRRIFIVYKAYQKGGRH